MNFFSSSKILYLVLCVALTGCGLPRSVPNKSEISRSSVTNGGKTYFVTTSDAVVADANTVAFTDFPQKLRSRGVLNTDTLRSGDRLTIVVYENVERGVFGSVNAPAGIPEVEIDQFGNIFVPYAGLVKAAGLTLEELRVALSEEIGRSTPDPQIQIIRAREGGLGVSVVGPTASGSVPVTPQTRRLTQLLAVAGGVSTEGAEATKITVKNQSVSGSVWLSDLFSGRATDIAMRPGDQVLITKDDRKFSLLGELGGQGLINFPKAEVSLLEAITIAGGLSSETADPKGIYVIRDETPDHARRILKDPSIQAPTRIVYVLDLTKPDGIFLARDLRMKDGDTVMVTESPYTQATKFLSVVLTTTNAAENLTTIGRN